VYTALDPRVADSRRASRKRVRAATAQERAACRRSRQIYFGFWGDENIHPRRDINLADSMITFVIHKSFCELGPLLLHCLSMTINNLEGTIQPLLAYLE